MNVKGKECLGLSTADALKKLYDDIAEVLKNHENKKCKTIPKRNEILPICKLLFKKWLTLY